MSSPHAMMVIVSTLLAESSGFLGACFLPAAPARPGPRPGHGAVWAMESPVQGRMVSRIVVDADDAHWARVALDQMLALPEI